MIGNMDISNSKLRTAFWHIFNHCLSRLGRASDSEKHAITCPWACISTEKMVVYIYT
jgi:hypothetical protein